MLCRLSLVAALALLVGPALAGTAYAGDRASPRAKPAKIVKAAPTKAKRTKPAVDRDDSRIAIPRPSRHPRPWM